ncbi:MAG TPA: redoxin domain-containing protein [Hanamia sp.]|nr:redoxin domain-containing protein [Hanamia sp.]
MKILRIIFMGILFGVINNVAAQSSEIRPLIKGQKVPNLHLSLHIGDSTYTTDLYDLKKKLILFDFWGIFCSSCIAQMPHLQKLQEEFGENIQIIIVTKNSKNEIDKLFKRINGHVSPEITYAAKHLPFIVEDTLLCFLFPHVGIPAHVWLDSAKILKGIAYDNSTTAENIHAFLIGKRVRLDEMSMAEIDTSNPLSWIYGDNEFLDQIKYYSFIFSRLKHKNGGDGEVTPLIDSATNKIVGLSCVNMSIEDLYKLSWFHYKSPNIGILNSKILLEVKNKEKFYPPKKNSEYFDWADTSLFSYAIKLPLKNADEIYNSMQQDLDSYFHYRSKFEYRKIRCLTLKRISNEDKIMTKGLKSKQELVVRSNEVHLNIQNTPMSYLFSRIESVIIYKDSYIPFFDETKYKRNIDINLPWSDDIKNISIPTLRSSLRKYGLDLVEEYKILRMIVISDQKLKQ